MLKICMYQHLCNKWSKYAFAHASLQMLLANKTYFYSIILYITCKFDINRLYFVNSNFAIFSLSFAKVLPLRNDRVFPDLFQILIIGLFPISQNYKTQNWASFAGP